MTGEYHYPIEKCTDLYAYVYDASQKKKGEI